MSSIWISLSNRTHLVVGHAIICPTASSIVNILVAGLQRNASALVAVSTNTLRSVGPRRQSLTKSSGPEDRIRPSPTSSSPSDQSTNTHLGCDLLFTLYKIVDQKHLIRNYNTKKLFISNINYLLWQLSFPLFLVLVSITYKYIMSVISSHLYI